LLSHWRRGVERFIDVPAMQPDRIGPDKQRHSGGQNARRARVREHDRAPPFGQEPVLAHGVDHAPFESHRHAFAREIL
jgi:hypothetical protein